MNGLDFYVIHMLYQGLEWFFCQTLKKKNFSKTASNWFKMTFLQFFMILRKKNIFFNFFIRAPPFDFFLCQTLKKIFFQNCIKLIKNYFLTDFKWFWKKKIFDFWDGRGLKVWRIAKHLFYARFKDIWTVLRASCRKQVFLILCI